MRKFTQTIQACFLFKCAALNISRSRKFFFLIFFSTELKNDVSGDALAAVDQSREACQFWDLPMEICRFWFVDKFLKLLMTLSCSKKFSSVEV